MITITLPWPDPSLSPNSRKHWRAKAGIQAAAHKYGYTVTRAATFNPFTIKGRQPVTMIFCPPDRRPRDLDNLGASMKWACDGVAQALGMNDKDFRPVTLDWGDVCKPGKVIVRIGQPQRTPYDYQGPYTDEEKAADLRIEAAMDKAQERGE